jgi:molybdenum cofactor cytidylyltransferase
MDFGPVPTDRALGATLAHSVHLSSGRLRKGKRLEQDDLAALIAAGHSSVIVARLGIDDIDEDSAALQLARAVCGDGLDLQHMGTGRVNLLARGPGLARIDAAMVHALNAIDPMITLATVPEWARMEAGGMVATVKIIAYGVARDSVARASSAGRGALSLVSPRLKTALLIQTLVAEDDGEKGQRVTKDRLERLGVSLGPKTLVPHRIEPLAQSLQDHADQTDLILILTGSATSDIHDVAPEALRAAGGRVEHFGMPVDPGNLLFLGSLGDVPVVGLPGCARSPALNGADFVIERLICGLQVKGTEIMGMGVGGLLKEIPTRPQPRARRTD